MPPSTTCRNPSRRRRFGAAHHADPSG
jgi:hypothetical protein